MVLVGGPVAHVGGPLAGVGKMVALISRLVAFIGEVVALVGGSFTGGEIVLGPVQRCGAPS